jgi:hypothetical protein
MKKPSGHSAVYIDRAVSNFGRQALVPNVLPISFRSFYHCIDTYYSQFFFNIFATYVIRHAVFYDHSEGTNSRGLYFLVFDFFFLTSNIRRIPCKNIGMAVTVTE